MPSLRFNGTFQPQLTSDSKDQPVPLQFLTQYSQKAMIDVSFTAAQVNYPVNDGTITTPAVVLIVCDEGEFHIACDAAGPGTGLWKLVADNVPPPPFLPFLLFATPNPAANTIYVTTPGAARGRVWIFQ